MLFQGGTAKLGSPCCCVRADPYSPEEDIVGLICWPTVPTGSGPAPVLNHPGFAGEWSCPVLVDGFDGYPVSWSRDI